MTSQFIRDPSEEISSCRMTAPETSADNHPLLFSGKLRPATRLGSIGLAADLRGCLVTSARGKHLNGVRS